MGVWKRAQGGDLGLRHWAGTSCLLRHPAGVAGFVFYSHTTQGGKLF